MKVPSAQSIPGREPSIQPMPVVTPDIRPEPVPDVDVHPVPVLVPHRRLHDRFTWLQLQELERIFQRNHYLNAEEG